MSIASRETKLTDAYAQTALSPKPSAMSVADRITEYLSGGGLFNPEYANHDAVRDLLIDCRNELGAIEAQAVERCANEVPTNWLDPLLTGPKAVIKGLDNRQIEALLRGIQDRIRALPRASDRRNGERRIQDYVYEGLPKRSGTDRRKGEA